MRGFLITSFFVLILFTGLVAVINVEAYSTDTEVEVVIPARSDASGVAATAKPDGSVVLVYTIPKK